MDVLFNASEKRLKSCIHVLNTYMEGTVSQIFYLDSCFIFLKTRKNVLVNLPKVTRFLSLKQKLSINRQSERQFPTRECY